MSDGGAAVGAAHRMSSGLQRAWRAWRVTPHESRLAAYAALGLFVSLFLPWYQRTFFVVVDGRARPASDSVTGWGAFSFVEAAILLIALSVLALLFWRAEGHTFDLPGGDGWMITAAGFWSGVLIVWRIFDKQGATSSGAEVTSYGVEWGIFVTLAVAVFLAYAGSRIRATARPEPPLPGADTGAWARSDRSSQAPGRSGRASDRTERASDRSGRTSDRSGRLTADRGVPRAASSTRASREAQPVEQPRPPASGRPRFGSAAFDSPPQWSGGDVQTFDTQQLGADRIAPTPEPTTRVSEPPDPHEQPTARLQRADGKNGASSPAQTRRWRSSPRGP